MKKGIISVLLIIVALTMTMAGCAPAEVQVVENLVEQTVVVEVEVEKEVVITATPEEARPIKKIAANVQPRGINTFREGMEIKGYEYEIYNAVLDRLGYDLHLVDVDFSGIFAGLQSEKWDLACSGIFITVVREEVMDFTTPHAWAFDVVTGLIDGPVDSLDDLAGKVIGTETGTSQAAYLSNLAEEYGPFETALYEDTEIMWADLRNGRIDAMSNGANIIPIRQGDPPDLKIIASSEDNYMIGCATRPGDPFVEEWNTAINELKEEGFLAPIFLEYYKFPALEGSPPVTIYTETYVPTK